eukprot:9667361-Lingulodinium_polyedra.AAC.1
MTSHNSTTQSVARAKRALRKHSYNCAASIFSRQRHGLRRPGRCAAGGGRRAGGGRLCWPRPSA